MKNSRRPSESSSRATSFMGIRKPRSGNDDEEQSDLSRVPTSASTLSNSSQSSPTKGWRFGLNSKKPKSSSISDDRSSIESPLTRVNTNVSMNSQYSSVYTLPNSHTKKLGNPSLKKTHRHTFSEEFDLEKPDDPNVIEHLFREVMADRDFENLPAQGKLQLENSSLDKKWDIIYQQKKNDFKNMRSREVASGSSRNISKTLGSIPERSMHSLDPKQYVFKLVSNQISSEEVKDLYICLSSEKVAWSETFLREQGDIALCQVLKNIYKTKPLMNSSNSSLPMPSESFTSLEDTYPAILDKEERLFRCIKVLADLRQGIRHLHANDIFVPTISGGLYSSKPQVRKLATDILTFYLHTAENPSSIYASLRDSVGDNVHLLYIKELYAQPNLAHQLDDRSYQILHNSRSASRYEVWLWAAQRMFQGRGRMGSKVGGYPEFKYSNITDEILRNYGSSTLLLIDSLIQKCSTIQERTKLRRLFQAAGLGDIFQLLKTFENGDIMHSIDNIEESGKADNQEMRQIEEFKNHDINFEDPVSLFKAMWKNSRGSESEEYLKSLMQNMFITNSSNSQMGGSDAAARNLKLVDRFVSNITMASGEDVTDMNISINKLIASYNTEEIARKSILEVRDLKRKLEELQAERDLAIERLNDGSKGTLEKMNRRLQESDLILAKLREENYSKDQEMKELQRKRMVDANAHEYEIRQMLIFLDSQSSPGNSAPLTNSSTITNISTGSENTVADLKAKLQQQLNHTRNEAKRIGTSGGVEPSSKLRDLRYNMDLLGQLGQQARTLENTDFEEFKIDDTQEDSNRKLNNLKEKLDNLQNDANDIVKLQNDLSQKEYFERKKLEALDRLKRLENYANTMMVSLSKETANPESLRTLDPRSREKSDTLTATQAELDSIEAQCRQLKFSLGLEGEDGIVDSAPAAADGIISKYSQGQQKVTSNITAVHSYVPSAGTAAPRPFLNELTSKVAKSGSVDDEADSSPATAISSKSSTEKPQSKTEKDLPSPPPSAPKLPSFLSGGASSAASTAPAPAPPPPPPPQLPSFLNAGSSSAAPPPPPPPPPPPMFNKSGNGSIPAPPPPPPMFGGGGPGAPPPPPFAFSIGKSPLPSPVPSPLLPSGAFGMLPRPKKKLKQLHWDKIDDTEDSFWQNMGSEETTRKLMSRGIFDEIEDIFAAKEARRIAKKKKDEQKKVSYLSSDISTQFGICLHPFVNLDDETVIKKILKCDKDVLDKPELLEFLNKPELTEISNSLLRDFEDYITEKKDVKELARADRVYLELIYKLESYWRSRMRSLITVLSFEKEYEELTSKLDRVDAALEGLTNSDSLKDVFEIILIVGNYMNDTSKQAQGFKLNTLQRLGFLKDHKNSMSFLHYVEKIIRENYPELLNFIDQLKPVTDAFKISIDQLRDDCNSFIQSVKNIDSSLQMGNLSDPSNFHPDDKFLNVVLKSLPDARTKAGFLTDRKKFSMEKFDKVMKFFGENPEEDDLARNLFFKKFTDFTESFKRVAEENKITEKEKQEYENKKRAAEAKAKEKEKSKDDGSSEMEKFLSQLRQSKPLRSEPNTARLRAWAKKHSAASASDEGKDDESSSNEKDDEPVSTQTNLESTDSAIDLMSRIQQNLKSDSGSESASFNIQQRVASPALRKYKNVALSRKSSTISVEDLDSGSLGSLSRSTSFNTSKTSLVTKEATLKDTKINEEDSFQDAVEDFDSSN